MGITAFPPPKTPSPEKQKAPILNALKSTPHSKFKTGRSTFGVHPHSFDNRFGFPSEMGV